MRDERNTFNQKNYWVATDARKAITMTKREFLNSVINGTINDEAIEVARKELAQMDAALEKRKNTLTPKQVANLELAEKIFEQLTESPKTASEVYALGIEGVTSANKVSSLCKLLGDRIKVTEVRVGSRIVKGYSK